MNAPSPSPNLAEATPLELLRRFAAVVDELKQRGIVRTLNNPVADYTEWLVASKLGLRLLGSSESGCDAHALDGKTKYQIKGRRVAALAKTAQLSALRNLQARPFDVLIAVIYEPDFVIRHALNIPFEVVLEKATYRAHTNSHTFYIRPSLLADPRIADITSTMAV